MGLAGFSLEPQQIFATGAPGGSSKMFPLIYPMGGINAVDPLAALDPRFCVTSINIIPDGRGGRVRSGYQEWAETPNATEVRTLVPHNALDPINSKLFSIDSIGITDVTDGGVVAIGELSFPDPTGMAGYGVWESFTGDSGTHYSFYADEVNGLYRYADAGTWAAVTDITGVDEEDLVFVRQYKSRLWFVERGTANAWYLDAGAISGTATKYNFGNKFQRGGTLVGLWNWTVDGGEGINDYLVAVSTGGDVIVMQFNDPSDASTFQQISQYYVGPVPAGRRLAASSGGELFLLSQLGVFPMSQLVSGRPVQEQGSLLSRAITPLVTQDMDLYRGLPGWELKLCSAEQVFLLSTPKIEGYPFKQYALSTKTQGWTIFKDLPYMNGEEFQGTFYLAGTSGLVSRFLGGRDNVPMATAGGSDIQFGLISAFSDVGEPGLYHRVQFIRPVFRASVNPSYSAEARYDYNITDPSGILAPVQGVGSVWDLALWDGALWGGGGVTTAKVIGGSGLGRAVAVALVGQTSGETQLLRIDVILDTGGML